MRTPVLITMTAALIVAGAIIIFGLPLMQPAGALIANAGFDRAAITPNADGQNDAAVFSYALSRDAEITIELTSDGQTFFFREKQNRPAGEYSVLFSGVVDNPVLPDIEPENTVERGLIPDGEYTWILTAVGLDAEETETATGTLTVTEADTPLPLMTSFTVSPSVFSPNQDGVADRVQVNVFLSQPADLRAYLIDLDGVEIVLTPRDDVRQTGEAGLQAFDYDGGLDISLEPPPDGVYTVVAEAQDAVGQRVIRRTQLEIRDGGIPQAEIVQQTSGADIPFATLPYDEAYFSSAETGLGEMVTPPDDPQDARLTQVIVRRGDLLTFKVTVENYGETPIRTVGPPPGTVYQQNQLPAALGEQNRVDGAWRISIECDTSETPSPYRWGLGTPETLVAETDPANDNVYYYLPPGERAVVWGAIRLTDVVTTRNPQECWVNLLHEGVAVRNNRVGARSIFIEDTDSASASDDE